MELYLLIAILGGICGFLSGLLGIGGGIILAPLLLYAPPLFGFLPLSMHDIAGLTIVQGFVACISGVIVHRHFKAVSGRLFGWMGITIFITALLGGTLSKHVPNHFLLLIFALLAIAAAILIIVPNDRDTDSHDITKLNFSPWRAVSSAGGVGILGGLVGQGGSFILIPLMTSFVHIPTRIAIGSNLAIILLSTSAAFLGKAFTSQIDWLLAVPIVLCVIPAAQFGSKVSHRVSVAKLRKILGILIVVAAVRILYSALSS